MNIFVCLFRVLSECKISIFQPCNTLNHNTSPSQLKIHQMQLCFQHAAVNCYTMNSRCGITNSLRISQPSAVVEDRTMTMQCRIGQFVLPHSVLLCMQTWSFATTSPWRGSFSPFFFFPFILWSALYLVLGFRWHSNSVGAVLVHAVPRDHICYL